MLMIFNPWSSSTMHISTLLSRTSSLNLFLSDTPITSKADSDLQYFWEAFPAGSGKQDRTTYLFTYMDAKKERPSIAEVCF